MKNALILHGTSSGPDMNWFPWLKDILLNNDYQNVWVPQLPHADSPNIDDNVSFILKGKFDFSSDTLIVGHSYGAYTALGLLGKLDQTVDTVVLVGLYKGYDLDLKKIKLKAKRFVLLHSDDDPMCPVEVAKEVINNLNGEKVIVSGEDHFAVRINPKHTTNPYLVDILDLRGKIER